jgi:UDP-N-acetylmuramoylalanine--D-glutamate ligase
MCLNFLASNLKPLTSLRAAAATILNVTEDHMDRYPLGLAAVSRRKADESMKMRKPVRGEFRRCIDDADSRG